MCSSPPSQTVDQSSLLTEVKGHPNRAGGGGGGVVVLCCGKTLNI